MSNDLEQIQLSFTPCPNQLWHNTLLASGNLSVHDESENAEWHRIIRAGQNIF